MLALTWLCGVQVTLSSLHKMFDSAKDIMQWLSNCAKVMAKANEAVQWTTPLGLPVVQPYRQKVGPPTNSHPCAAAAYPLSPARCTPPHMSLCMTIVDKARDSRP